MRLKLSLFAVATLLACFVSEGDALARKATGERLLAAAEDLHAIIRV